MKTSKMWLFSVCLLSFASLLSAENSCGKSLKSSAFLANGTVSEQGVWPWIVSLHDIKTEEFFCGGTLIGPQAVLTVSQTKFS